MRCGIFTFNNQPYCLNLLMDNKSAAIAALFNLNLGNLLADIHREYRYCCRAK